MSGLLGPGRRKGIPLCVLDMWLVRRTGHQGLLLPTAGQGGEGWDSPEALQGFCQPAPKAREGLGARAGALGFRRSGVPPAARCWGRGRRHCPAQGNFAVLEKTEPSPATFCQVGRGAVAMSRGVQGTLNPGFPTVSLEADGSGLCFSSGQWEGPAGGDRAGGEGGLSGGGFP